MELNWEAIGAAGEIIGALAVVVTLVYLTFQLRQNTRAVEHATHRGVYEDGHEWMYRLIENPEVAEQAREDSASHVRWFRRDQRGPGRQQLFQCVFETQPQRVLLSSGQCILPHGLHGLDMSKTLINSQNTGKNQWLPA